MKLLGLLFCLSFIFSCKEATKEIPSVQNPHDTITAVVVKEDIPSVKRNKTIQESGIDSGDSLVYVSYISTFDGTDPKHYIPLYFRSGYTWFNEQDITTQSYDSIPTAYDYEYRVILNDSVAQQYINTDGLENIVIVDQDQNYVKQLQLDRYELYYTEMGGELIASYPQDTGLSKKSLVISGFPIADTTITKSPVVIENSTYTKHLLEDYHLSYNQLHYAAHCIAKEDTIAISSLSYHKENKEQVLVFKNGQLLDSIQNDFLLKDFRPVPLASANRYVFMAFAFVPESDVYWDALIAIHPETGKITFLEQNRIKI